MIDCPNAEIRDLLPELLHGSLDPATEAMVRAHLDGCADCRAELALLGDARVALSPVLQLDPARIVSAIQPYRRRAWFRTPAAYRLAAAVVLLAIGGASYSIVGPSLNGPVTLGDESAFGSPSDNVAGSSFDPLSVSLRLEQFTDEELEAILAGLENMEAVPLEEPRRVSPTIGWSASGAN